MNRFLDPLDSAFVLLETPGTAVNIGALIELDDAGTGGPEERFGAIYRTIADRLHEIPVLTQRVVRAPFDMTWPILVADGHFDLGRHVVRAALPAPGSPEQLGVLVSEFYSRPLNPERPLWQLLVIEGRDEGRTALALKVHHALADGVSGAETFASFFDISPEVRAPSPMPETSEDDTSVTTSLGLLREGVARIAQRPSLVLEGVSSWGGRAYEILRALYRVLRVRGHRHVTNAQPSIFEARATSLNGAPGVEKSYERTRVPLAAVKGAARQRGATVTDFVMTTASGALRRLLDERGERLKRDLVAFVPINVRSEGAAADLGNQISGMLIALHTNVLDREERLARISREAQATAGEQRVQRARVFQDVPRVVGPTLLSLGAKFLGAFGLIDRLPMANVMISSVPGPPIPLWLSGRRVLSASPVGPLLGSISLNITVLGFEEYLEFGLLASSERFGDLALLRRYLYEEATALIEATTEGSR